MYGNEKADDVLTLTCGGVVIYIKRFPNQQIRNEISIENGYIVADADGFVIRPMNTKMCRVKKIGSCDVLSMKVSSFKRVRESTFHTYNKNSKCMESKTLAINCY